MMFDLWPVYSGERFRASEPSCFEMLAWTTFVHISKCISKCDILSLPVTPRELQFLLLNYQCQCCKSLHQVDWFLLNSAEHEIFPAQAC